MFLALIALPLSTFLTIALFGRFLGARGTIVISSFSSVLTVIFSLLISYEVILCSSPCCLTYSYFFNCNLFDGNLGMLFDPLTALMGIVVTLISCLVIIYSYSYMIADPHFIRFISYLKMFTVAMLILVTASNYIQLFVGWEGVGLASFLLISFWFNRLQANKAAIQAMLLNRVGDLGLIIGISTIYWCFKTTDYQGLFCCNYQISNLNRIVPMDFACLCLFIGAAGKSGQFGLHSWLPNAMNAPTPVSALLHAATMVTAGVFLLVRSSPLLAFAPLSSTIITVVGAITTVVAGTIGLVQYDFKGIIAYSTCSQLGFMITICGLSYYDVSMFHLINHAWFKALLFLSAGSLIHGLSDQQDIRKFGGLKVYFSFSHCMFIIGTLALIGTPFLSGFYSKDLIVELATSRYSLSGNFSFALIIFSVFTTSYYSFRLLFLVFEGTQICPTNTSKPLLVKINDSDWLMSLVLIILATLSIIGGWLLKTLLVSLGTDSWNNSIFISNNTGLIEFEFLPQPFKLMPLFASLVGALIAYFSVNRNLTYNLLNIANIINITMVNNLITNIIIANSWIRDWVLINKSVQQNSCLQHLFRRKHLFNFLNQRWFFDKLINGLIALPAYNFGFVLLKIFDKGLIETSPIGALVLPTTLNNFSQKLAISQSGLIYHYAIIMIISSFAAMWCIFISETDPIGVHLINYELTILLISCLTIL